MKIKLLHIPRYDINPFLENVKGHPNHPTIHFLPPLGIATLTAFLKKNGIFVSQDDLMIKCFYHNLVTKDENKKIDLKVFSDAERLNKFVKSGYDSLLESEGMKILKLTQCDGFDIFGFSIYETTNPSPTGVALVLGKLLRDKYGAKIIVGGEIPKETLRFMLKTGWVDYGILGNAEIKLFNFCEMVERGVEIEKVPGVFYIDRKGEMKYNQTSDEAERRQFPIKPDFTGLPMELYKPKINYKFDSEWYEDRILVLPYLFVRGCTYKCAFCSYALGNVILKDPEMVSRELLELSKKYNTKYFFFINTNINPTYKYANDIADKLIKYDVNILWSDCATFHNIDEKLLRKLKEAGATKLVFGLESASPAVLKYVNKPISVDKSKKILRVSNRIGIWNELEIICGFPYEKEEDIEKTIKFLLENKNYIQAIHVSKFRADGMIREHPKKFGITLHKMEESSHRIGHFIPFDEIYGMSWNEKIKQINRFYLKIMEAMKPTYTHLTFNKLNLPRFTDNGIKFINFVNWWKDKEKYWSKDKKCFMVRNKSYLCEPPQK